LINLLNSGTLSASSALTTAVKGAQKAQTDFSNAATDLVNTYSAAANVVSGADLSPEAFLAASDPVSPVVDMKVSQRAYEASLTVFSAVNDMEDALLDIKA